MRSKGDSVPLRYAPSPLHGRGGSGHESRGSGVKVRQSWTFTEIFYAALCGAPVLPVLPKAKCGRRLRPFGREKGTPSACLFCFLYNTCDMMMAQSMMGILNAMKVGMQVSRI